MYYKQSGKDRYSHADADISESINSEGTEIQRLKLQLLATGKFRNVEYLSSGSFGHVYSAYDEGISLTVQVSQQSIINKLDLFDERSVKKPNCAIKVERISSEGDSRLHAEYFILQRLQELSVHHPNFNNQNEIEGKMANIYGFPRVFSYGRLTNSKYLSMDLLGDNLATLVKRCGGSFTQKTIMMIALQCIERLRDLHYIGYLHRDVKPENILIGSTETTKAILYFVDFGLAKAFNAQRSGRHDGFHVGMAGTLRYASVYTIAGEQQSFRDDMISLTYSLSFLASGRLPWQGMKVQRTGSTDIKHSRRKKVLEIKKSTPLQELCKHFPPDLTKVVEHIHSLGFFTMPSYANYISWIKEFFDRRGDKFDYNYDWDDKDQTNIRLRSDSSARTLSRAGPETSLIPIEESQKCDT
ncbi:hypothetical protein GJ496_003160 [Pomphorhynchus laevis]|nr:hypothetical protein GJ496_003160 [Pomphorhynchus laevis]